MISTIRPNGDNSIGTSNVVGAATHWQAVSDANDSTYIYQNDSTPGDPWFYDYYTVSTMPLNSPLYISQLTFYFRGSQRYNNGATGYVSVGVKTYGTDYILGSAGFNSQTPSTSSVVSTTNPHTGLPWTKTEVANLILIVGLKSRYSFPGADAVCHDVWIDARLFNNNIWVQGTDFRFISQTGGVYKITGSLVASGVSTIYGHIWIDGTDLLYIDEMGDKRKISGTTVSGVPNGILEFLWVEYFNIYYIDEYGVARLYTGTAI